MKYYCTKLYLNKKGNPASGRQASENGQKTSNPVLLFTGLVIN